VYVLVLIMTFQGNMKVQAFHSLFTDYNTCMKVAIEMEERLVSTKPSPDATANTYCFEIPKSI
jgi:hypothetical protein